MESVEILRGSFPGPASPKAMRSVRSVTRAAKSVPVPMCVVFLACGAASLGAGVEKIARSKYQEVFYPAGTPILDNVFTGKKEKSVYTYYGEAEVPGSNARFVLYSESLPQEGSDGVFSVRLGTVKNEGGKSAAAEIMELTDYIDVYTEFPGNFEAMDGRVNVFPITKDLLGLHVNLWDMLSGSGAISSAGDLIFQFQAGQEGRLKLVLELKKTSAYARTGWDSQGGTGSTISVADLDGDGVSEVIVETRSRGETERKVGIQVRKPGFYKYVEGKFTLVDGKAGDDLARSRAARTVLQRSPDISIGEPQ